MSPAIRGLRRGRAAADDDLARIEAHALATLIEADPDVTFEADQLAQGRVAFLRVGIFDQHRGSQLLGEHTDEILTGRAPAL